jgi:hypothetical protein
LRFGQRSVKDGDVGAQIQGTLNQIDSDSGIPLLMTQNPQHVKRAGVGLIAIQDRLIHSSRSHQVAHLVSSSRLYQFVASDCNHGNFGSILNPGRRLRTVTGDRAIHAVETERLDGLAMHRHRETASD